MYAPPFRSAGRRAVICQADSRSRPSGRPLLWPNASRLIVFLCSGARWVNVRFCRVVSADWRPGRVYFLTFLEPLAGTTGLRPLPPSRPVSATVGRLNAEVH
jgi:hypothetical protein